MTDQTTADAGTQAGQSSTANSSSTTTTSQDKGGQDKGGKAAGGDKGAGKGGGAAGGEAASWLEALPEGLRGDPALSKYESLEAFANAHKHLTTRFGIPPERRIDLPEDMNNAEAMAAVWKALGRPEKPEGYGVKLAKDFPEEMKPIADEIVATGHALGLTTGQMGGLIELLNKQTAAAAAAQSEINKAAAEQTIAAAKKEFGDKYETYQVEITKLLGESLSPEDVAELNASGLGNSLPLIRLMAKMCDLRAEPGKAPGEGGRPAGGDRAMTPAEAKGALAAMDADPVKVAALHDGNHALHKTLMAERERLLKAAYPDGS